MKKTLALILTAIMLTGLLAGCGAATQSQQQESAAAPAPQAAAQAAPESADSTVFQFNVSFPTPDFMSVALTDSFNRIQEASQGRIEFTYYYSWSLSSVATIIDDINAGVVDIGTVPLNEHLNIFPYSNLVSQTPFLGFPNVLAAGKIYDDMYDNYEDFAKEYENCGLVYWTNFVNAPYHLFTTTEKEIVVPTDMNGLKIITGSAELQQLIKNSGGAAVSAPVTDYATSLNTNVVDGAINHGATFSAFGCIEFLKSATKFGDKGMSVSIAALCFSKEAWESLPADLQQLFIDEAATLRDGYSTEIGTLADGAFAALEQQGSNIRVLSDEEIQVWADAFSGIAADYIQDLESDGYDKAQTYYDAVRERIAQY